MMRLGSSGSYQLITSGFRQKQVDEMISVQVSNFFAFH
jgi:hypothetical protein